MASPLETARAKVGALEKRQADAEAALAAMGPERELLLKALAAGKNGGAHALEVHEAKARELGQALAGLKLLIEEARAELEPLETAAREAQAREQERLEAVRVEKLRREAAEKLNDFGQDFETLCRELGEVVLLLEQLRACDTPSAIAGYRALREYTLDTRGKYQLLMPAENLGAWALTPVAERANSPKAEAWTIRAADYLAAAAMATR